MTLESIDAHPLWRGLAGWLDVVVLKLSTGPRACWHRTLL